MLTSPRAPALCALALLAFPAVAVADDIYVAPPAPAYDAPMPYLAPLPPVSSGFTPPQFDPIPVPKPAPDFPTTDLSPPPSSDAHMIPPNCNLSGCANTYSSDPLDPWR